MKQRFTEEQIVEFLSEHQNGRQATKIVRELGISEQTFEGWKHKYVGMGVSNLKRLKQREEENRRLKELVAELSLDNKILGDVASKTCRACCEARNSGRPGLTSHCQAPLKLLHATGIICLTIELTFRII